MKPLGMKTLRPLLGACTFSVAVGASIAAAEVNWSFPQTLFEDDYVNFLIKGQGNDQAGVIEVGDVLLAVLEFNKSAGADIQPEELTGVAVVELNAFIDLDGSGGANDMVFKPAAMGFDFYSGTAPLPDNAGIPGAGGMVAMWLDGTPNLTIGADVITAGNPSCTTQAACIAQGTDGDSWMVLGFGGDADDSWIALNANPDVNVVDVSDPQFNFGFFNTGLSVMVNNSGQPLAENEMNCIPFCGLGGDSMTDMFGSADIKGGGENLVASEWFSSGDIDMSLRPTNDGGGEGCTPGYWKQEHHFDSWTAPYDPDDLFGDWFEDAFPGLTLLDVLWLEGGGNGLNKLGAHTVAALLNAASGGVDYDIATPQDVIDQFNAVYPGSKKDYNGLKDIYEGFNEQGCPLN